VSERREVLLVMHPDRETTKDAAREVATRFDEAGIGLRVIDDEVKELLAAPAEIPIRTF